MTDTVIAKKPLEDRADIESLEYLQHERALIVPRWAALGAKFKGGNGVASSDSLRKQNRAEIMCKIAQEKFGPEGLTKDRIETMLERLANADPRHIEFCENLRKDFEEFLSLDVQKTEIEERIQSRNGELFAYAKEAGLQ